MAAARKLIAKGQDPVVQVNRERKRQDKAQADNSFENVAREWHGKQGRWRWIMHTGY